MIGSFSIYKLYLLVYNIYIYILIAISLNDRVKEMENDMGSN